MKPETERRAYPSTIRSPLTDHNLKQLNRRQLFNALMALWPLYLLFVCLVLTTLR